MGNINAIRDWGHARDYVEMQWRMLQQEKPEDFVIATGKEASVKEFIELSAKKLNWGGIDWSGDGLDEIGRRKDNGDIVVKVDPKFLRPAEVQQLQGDPSKQKNQLGWEPSSSIEELIAEMIESDKNLALEQKK